MNLAFSGNKKKVVGGGVQNDDKDESRINYMRPCKPRQGVSSKRGRSLGEVLAGE